MGFTELLGQLRNPGEDGLPESIYDDLASEYQLAVDGGAAAAAALRGDLDAALAENLRLKATNFDLLTASGPTVMDEPGAAEAADEVEDEDDEDSPAGVDALFGKDED